MSFLWPIMFPFLILIPLFVLYYLAVQRRRRSAAARAGNLGILREAGGREPGTRRHVPALFFLAALTSMLLALARPQAAISLPKREGTVMLTFDVSGSMAADDLKPTRMEAAKTVARDFVARQPTGVQIGIVAFSEGGLSVQVPTNEHEALLAAIDRLSPQRGTSLGQGILVALNAIGVAAGEPPLLSTNPTPAPTAAPAPAGSNTSAIIVLLTDGENTTEPDPLEVAQFAAERGVRVYTIGIGSPAGAILQVEGFSVHTQLDEAMLQEIARITRGAYYNAQSEEDLREIYESIEPQLKMQTEKIEVTAILAGLGLLMLLVGGAFSLLWFGRLP